MANYKYVDSGEVYFVIHHQHLMALLDPCQSLKYMSNNDVSAYLDIFHVHR